MTNKELYKKTLGFSLRRALWDLLCILLLAALTLGGFYIAEKTSDKGLIGLGAGAVIGIVAIIFILRFVSYYFKAGQIAMMTRGIVDGELPDDVIAEGKRTVKERFATVAVFYAVTGVIKGIFRQLGRLITSVGESIGGDTGSTVGSIISSVIETVIAYLCDCCLGWVFFRKEEKSARATCEGAVIFFRHGKTLAKNMGRVFGIGLLSLLAIGGVFGVIAYFIMVQFPDTFARLAVEFTNIEKQTGVTKFLADPGNLTIAAAALAGIIIWAVIHSVFIRPFVLAGVLRNYITSGIGDIPDEASFAALDSKSAKFKKLHAEIA